MSAEAVRGSALLLTPEGLRHVRRVLRLKEGDLLRATDGSGWEYLVRLEGSGGAVDGRILERSRPSRESPFGVLLIQALPKRGLMELIIQKAVELGVREIQPVVTSRTVAAPGRERHEPKGQRWQRIAEAAVAQSGRVLAPRLHGVSTWEEVLSRGVSADLRLLLGEGAGQGLEEVLDRRPAPAAAAVAVGPEGGWDEREVELARKAGFEVAGLGPRVLRAETAGLAALAVLQFLYGDMGGPAGNDPRRSVVHCRRRPGGAGSPTAEGEGDRNR